MHPSTVFHDRMKLSKLRKQKKYKYSLVLVCFIIFSILCTVEVNRLNNCEYYGEYENCG